LGSTIPTIGLAFFRRYKIILPESVEEQEVIGKILLSLDDHLFAIEDDLRGFRRLKKGLMHDLLTGRVRVPESMLREAAAR
jgi:type I restriction enzyme S subunit